MTAQILDISSSKPSWLEGYSRVAVIGLGVTGISVLEYLSQYALELLVMDTRDAPNLFAKAKELTNHSNAQTTYFMGEINQSELLTSDLIVLSPGVSLKTPAIKTAIEHGVEVCGDIDIVARTLDVPIIAITGSNGKSTVTTLVGEICKAAGLCTFMGGNLGIPAMYLLSQRQVYDIAVLELSSFQLETTNYLKPLSSVVLNISADHMDRYDSFNEYSAAKARIYRASKYAIYNRDDPLTKEGLSANSKVSSFGLEANGSQLADHHYSIEAGYIMKGATQLVPVSELKMIGRHNVANAMAALALVEPLAIDLSVCGKVLKEFCGLPHRTQLVAEIDGVRWVNDSKATNVGACQAAIDGLDDLEAMGGGIILIAGGQGKDGDFTELTSVLKTKVKHVLLFGEDAALLNAAWSNSTACELVENMGDAVELANQCAQQHDTVLLSPACASFDMYSGYVARGEHFINLVNDLSHAGVAS